MKKVKVFTAIGMTFAFLVQHIADVVRIVWLPLVLQLAAFLLLMPGYMRTTTELQMQADIDPAAALAQLAPALGELLIFIAVLLFSTVAVFSGLTKLIVKGEKPRLPFYLGWGADEWRILGGWVLFALIIAGCELVLVAFGAVVGGLLAGPGIALALIAALAFGVAMIWVSVRLSMSAPAAIATGKIGLRESWERTEDDFWNLVGYWILLGLAGVVVQLVLLGYLTPPGVFEAYQGAEFTPEGMRAVARKANEAVMRGYDLSDMANVVRLTIGYLLGALSGIITAIAGAVAWRMIADNPSELEATF